VQRHLIAIACVVALGLTAVSAIADPPADVVLRYGKIHTQDPTRRVVQALALRGTAIVSVGTDQAVSALIGPRTRTIDLGDRIVLPGIIDAHTRPAESAQELDRCSLGDKTLAPAEIKAQMVPAFRYRARELPTLDTMGPNLVSQPAHDARRAAADTRMNDPEQWLRHQSHCGWAHE
jgi:predicted amidohydrolase YtcJ